MHGALQGQIATEQPRPCSCSVPEEASARYLLAPLGFLGRPGAAGTGMCFLPSRVSHAPRAGGGTLMAALGSSTLPALHPQETCRSSGHPAFPASVYPTAGGSGNGHPGL